MDELVERAVNASLPVEIDAATLAGCLSGRIDPTPWRPHLAAFFTELRVEVIEEFLAQHAVPASDAMRAYERVARETGERSRDVDDWLGYLAGPAA